MKMLNNGGPKMEPWGTAKRISSRAICGIYLSSLLSIG